MKYLGHSTLVIALFSASTLFGAEGGLTGPSSLVPPVPEVKNADYYRGRLAQSEVELKRTKSTVEKLQAELQRKEQDHQTAISTLKTDHAAELKGKECEIENLKKQIPVKAASRPMPTGSIQSTAYVVFKLPQQPTNAHVTFGGTSVDLSSEPVQMIQVKDVRSDRRVVFNYGSKQVGSILRPNAITIVDLNRMEVAAR